MEMDILDSLDDLGFKEKIDESMLKDYIREGPKCIKYTQLIEWLSKELQLLCNMEDSINSILDSEDSNSFLLETSSFLKELNCPYKLLTEGPVNQRLANEKQRLLFLDYLCSELQAARIIFVQNNKRNVEMEMEIDESNVASDLKNILNLFNADMPIENINSKELFNNLEIKAKEYLSRINKNDLSVPLLNDEMTKEQWLKLQNLYEEMHKEFHTRREMLLKRLDVTVQSCKWGERLKGKEDEIGKVFFPLRKLLHAEPSVQLYNILIAREDCATIQEVSSSNVTTNDKVYKHMIGYVPDRGGRPEEQYCAREMPNWKKRSGGGGGGDRGRGSRGRGSWSNRGSKFGKNKRHAFDAAGSYGN